MRTFLSSGSPGMAGPAGASRGQYRERSGTPAFARVFTSPLWRRARTRTGTNDPQAADMLYHYTLAVRVTGSRVPKVALNALANQARRDSNKAEESGGCEALLVRFSKAGTKRKDSKHDHTRRAAH